MEIMFLGRPTQKRPVYRFLKHKKSRNILFKASLQVVYWHIKLLLNENDHFWDKKIEGNQK